MSEKPNPTAPPVISHPRLLSLFVDEELKSQVAPTGLIRTHFTLLGSLPSAGGAEVSKKMKVTVGVSGQWNDDGPLCYLSHQHVLVKQ